jgi:hypothetical protein
MILMILGTLCGAAASQHPVDPWAADFAAQRPSERLRLECRYVDVGRTQAEVLAEDYHLVLHLADEGKSRARVLKSRAAGRPGLIGDLHLEVDSGGEVFSSLQATGNSRINLYRRGPYYIEVHWFDVQCVAESGAVFPAKGEVALYCYSDQLLVQAIWHAVEGAEGMRPGTARIAWSGGGNAEREFAALKPGDKVSAAMPLLGLAMQTPPAEAIELLDGLDASYDPARGCYVVRTDNPGGFSYHYYENPNHYETARFRIGNDGSSRKVYVCHATRERPGSVECGVVLDGDGDPLPIVVQISKNFAGEKEEAFYNPQDTPFSETIFPLHLAPNETRELTSLHLYQNWGNHPLKQFSSLGAWMDYYHSSTGVTETTCFVPFKFGGLPGVAIADLRPMSQRMWESQPQHDNVAGHRFLMYRAGDAWHYARYLGTTFRSTGPNWFDISLDYLSDDGCIRARLDSFELPQTDELRNFIRLRCEVLQPVRIERLATDFRLLDITSRIQRLRYKHAAWQTGRDDVAVRDLGEEDALAVAGEPLGGEFPWATVYGERKGCNSFVVRRFDARLGGDKRGPAVCVQTHKSGDMSLALTPSGEAAELEPGDFVEAEFYIMPYGNDENTYETPQKDRVPFGADAPRVTAVARGSKLGDFPCRIRAGKQGLAEFTIVGGTNLIPVVVEGLKTYKQPRLELAGAAGWAPVRHETVGNDGYQVFVDDRGTFGCVFLVEGSSEPRTYRVVHAPRPRIIVHPRLRPEDAPMANLVEVQAPWMDQPINIRYPETIHTDFGLLQIDHYREDMIGKTDLSTLSDWHAGPGGSFWFDWDLAEKCKAGGIVSPGVDDVTFEFWFYNGNDKPTSVHMQYCLRLWADSLRDETGERTYIMSDGKWVRMADTDRGGGRRELVHYPVAGGPDLGSHATDPNGWGASDVVADFGLVAVQAADGRHVLGLAWPKARSILSNWLIPCIHADPIWPTCNPRGHVRVCGKLYLIEGTLADLLARQEEDMPTLR